MNRYQFIRQSALAAGIGLVGPQALLSQKESEVYNKDEITEFVFAAHSDFQKTKEIIDSKPLILNCVSQVQQGDFETAVGGASHMGRRDIAELLVERGARLDLFNLTFLGFVDFTKQLIEMHPQYLMASGPHGFTLLHHAKVGKHKSFADWLIDQGLNEDRFMNVFN